METDKKSAAKRIYDGRFSRPEYRVWYHMCRRINVPTHRQYADYGGRGLDMDPRWLTFENFFADMGKRPEGLSLDRIDNDRGYWPDNCRWATHSQQQRNKRKLKRNPDMPRKISPDQEFGPGASIWATIDARDLLFDLAKAEERSVKITLRRALIAYAAASEEYAAWTKAKKQPTRSRVAA